ncbi:hypothetical protein SARC_05048 [Sphaeroforma arctica JP610]|uniref:C2H2-type domain-containing protein n=1 Tax=Sphaeroforma arctica JP610 TaxID=667725 RepID=A0A0L0G1I6_9EUKA|nr:hypothetical protein SARC_05048 [Sphaeroforma arctica JP610]KNC82671.1 hypothetical protein SARC_05048 [Sphaeroforma arctica JP610]|eukprot:XP_014156573.1 hypothetical protein SARC_05048 [Sphaeroforma arctica JP610]
MSRNDQRTVENDSHSSDAGRLRNDDNSTNTGERWRLNHEEIASRIDAMNVRVDTDLSLAEIVDNITRAISVDVHPSSSTQDSTINYPEVSRSGSLPGMTSSSHRMLQNPVLHMVDNSFSVQNSSRTLARNYSGPRINEHHSRAPVVLVGSMGSGNLYHESSHSSISTGVVSSGALTTPSSDMMATLSTAGNNNYHQPTTAYNHPLYVGRTDSIFDSQLARVRPSMPNLTTQSQQTPSSPDRPHPSVLRQSHTQPSQQQKHNTPGQRPASVHFRPMKQEENFGGLCGRNETRLQRRYQSEDDFSFEHRYNQQSKLLADDLDLMLRAEEDNGPQFNLHGSKIGANKRTTNSELVQMKRWGSANGVDIRRDYPDSQRATRRRPCQLDRPYVCPSEGCPYRYEWWRSLQHHLAKKHNLRKKKSDYPQFVDLPTR